MKNNLEKEIADQRQQILTDGYEMSFGELMSLYKERELIINPAFQRYYRWTLHQKTSFIESIILGIPYPPIFVFQTDNGTWELVDGLQRISTILEFTGLLNKSKPLALAATKYLPSLEGVVWEQSGGDKSLPSSLKLTIKRARIRVEILKKGSSDFAKYELFQRLNSGGSILTPEESRTCTVSMLNEWLFNEINRISRSQNFTKCLKRQAESQLKRKDVDLILRFLILRHSRPKSHEDAQKFLSEGVLLICPMPDSTLKADLKAFEDAFSLFAFVTNTATFQRPPEKREESAKKGRFSMPAFEAITYGVGININAIKALSKDKQIQFLEEGLAELWAEETFNEATKGGVRASARLPNILDIAKKIFDPQSRA